MRSRWGLRARIPEHGELSLRRAYSERPVGADLPPEVFIRDVSASGGAKLELLNAATRRRKLPVGMVGAAVFGVSGDQAPDARAELRGEPLGWHFLGNVTRPRGEMRLPGAWVEPGASVWLSAGWLDKRLAVGPRSKLVRA
ncbi:MAG: hypothetical protein AAGF84_09790 [Planctomycetota bacterium]